MEWQNSKIQLGGLNLANSDIDCPDGSCQEVINMRYKDGSWRPTDETVVDWVLADTDMILYKHPVLATDYFICYDPTYQDIFVMNMSSQGSRVKILDLTATGDTFNYFHHINNVLFVITNKNKYIFVYDENSTLKISGTHYRRLKHEKLPMGQTFLTQTVELKNSGIYDSYADALVYLNYLIRLHKDFHNSYSGDCSVRFAYRLFDGEYIKHSLPLFSRISYDANCEVEMTPTTYKIINYPIGNIYLKLYFESSEIDELKQWHDIIQSLDIFINHRSLYDLARGGGYPPGSGITKIPMQRFKYSEPFIDSSNYYKVASIRLEDISTSNSKKLEIEDELEAKELLPVDDYSHHNLWGNNAFNFNSRIHFGDTYQLLFEGYSQLTINDDTDWGTHYLPAGYSRDTNPGTLTLYLLAYIETHDDDYIIIHQIPYYYPYIKTGDPNLLVYNDIFGYNDNRAKYLSLVSYNGADYKLLNNWRLIPHPILNIAYHSGVGSYGKALTVEETSGPPVAFPNENRILRDKNRIQLSGLDNPFIFPAKNSYRVGGNNNVITGLSSITKVISEGQYGEFPIYIFTSQGIWLLGQGKEEIAYESILPLSKEIILNKNAYLQVEDGIIFIAGDSIYFISGTEIKRISKDVEGIPASYLIGYSAYDDKINDSTLVELSNVLNTLDFVKYIQSAILCYNNFEKELIVSESTKNYSYIYAIETGVWSKSEKVYNQFIKSDPTTYAIDTDGNGISLYLHSENTNYQNCLLQTRPIKLAGSGLKKIERIFGDINAEIKAGTKLGFYIYGSRDGEEWKILRGIQVPSTVNLRNLMLGRIHVSIRYAIILITLQTKNCEVKGLNFQFTPVYNTKLR